MHLFYPKARCNMSFICNRCHSVERVIYVMKIQLSVEPENLFYKSITKPILCVYFSLSTIEPEGKRVKYGIKLLPNLLTTASDPLQLDSVIVVLIKNQFMCSFLGIIGFNVWKFASMIVHRTDACALFFQHQLVPRPINIDSCFKNVTLPRLLGPNWETEIA